MGSHMKRDFASASYTATKLEEIAKTKWRTFKGKIVEVYPYGFKLNNFPDELVYGLTLNHARIDAEPFRIGDIVEGTALAKHTGIFIQRFKILYRKEVAK